MGAEEQAMSETSAQAIAERARAKGWPEGLAERALAVGTPSGLLENWLNAPPEANILSNIERNLQVNDRLATGPYRARELTGRDIEAFGELWANGPEKAGDWLVTIERSPNPLAQFQLQPGASISVIEGDGQLLACTVWASANCLIAGKPVSI